MSKLCDKYTDRIIDYSVGLLSSEQAAEIEQHLAVCEKCRKFADKIETEDNFLSGHFGSFSADIKRGQQEVIEAVKCFRTDSKQLSILSLRNMLDSFPVKVAVAVGILAFFGFYFLKVHNCMYAVEQYMDICSIIAK